LVTGIKSFSEGNLVVEAIPQGEISRGRNSFSFAPLPAIARVFDPGPRERACLKTTPAV
jgi:hypothetical protein